MAKDNTPDLEEGGAEQKNVKQRVLLLVLLLLLAVFGYLYFFTGMIKPREEAAKPELPQAVQVKKPLPPRPVEGETETKQPAVKHEPPAAKEAVAAKPAVEEPANAGKPQEESASKGATPAKQEKAKSAPPAKAAEPAKTAEPKAQPVAAKKTAEPVATKTAEKKPAAAPTKTEKPVAAGAVAKKKPGAKAGAEQEGAKKAAAAKPTHKRATRGKFTLLIGEFVPNKTFLALEAKLIKQGVKPLGKTSLKKPEPMNRLFVAAYGDYESAAAELEKLKKLTSDAFYIENAGKYTLYAGSYYDMALVEKERKRLAGKGYKIEVQKVAVPVAVVRLTAGSFSAKEDAERVAASLKKQGVTASVITQAK
jgi:hypothetical protein